MLFYIIFWEIIRKPTSMAELSELEVSVYLLLLQLTIRYLMVFCRIAFIGITFSLMSQVKGDPVEQYAL